LAPKDKEYDTKDRALVSQGVKIAFYHPTEWNNGMGGIMGLKNG
jgi:hypothetical protein